MAPTTLFAVKGGAGVSVVAAALAVSASRSGPVLLVDRGGDLPAVLGLAEPDGPGVHDWLASEGSGATALRRLEVPVREGLALLPRGRSELWPHDRERHLADELAGDPRTVVVDGGPHGPPAGGRAVLVTRACYLALRRAAPVASRADGVVVVAEPGRALGARDVARLLDLPLLATVESDPAVARAVDSGRLLRRLPGALGRSVRGLG